MSNKAKVGGKVPRLRFPEFRNAPEWEHGRLKDLCERIMDGTHFSPKSKTGPHVYLTSKNIQNGVIDLSNISCISEEEHRAIYEKCPVIKNDVLLTKDGANTGNCALNNLDFKFSLLSSVAVLRGKSSKVDQRFLYQACLSDKTQRLIQESMTGQAITRITLKKIGGFSISIASIEEQQKIADCLSSIDELISAQTQKLDALKAHKKSLMQQLFPAEGETVPKLRFPKFRDAGEWKKQKISGLLKRVSRPVNVDLDEMYRQIGIRSHGKGIFYKELVSGKDLGNKRVFWVEEDAFIVNIVFAWEQAIANTSTTEKGMIASHRFPMYKAKANKSDVNYVKYFFLTEKGKELLGLASPGGAGRNKTLGQKEFENLEFIFPEKVEEQTKIAACLSSLDDLITTQTQKIEALKAHKKGLMQQLFPSADEAHG